MRNSFNSFAGRARHSVRAGVGMEEGREEMSKNPHFDMNRNHLTPALSPGGPAERENDLAALGGFDFNGATARAERRALPCAAFTLLEVMVAVTLMSVMIVGLVVMFNQTRRAFTGSMTQVDVLESGRAAADIIAREVEQIAPYGLPAITNFMVYVPLAGVANLQGTTALFPNSNPATYILTQPLTDTNVYRTNILDAMLFTVPQNDSQNQEFSYVGYRLDKYNEGVGSLYRYQRDNIQTTNFNGSHYYTFAAYQPYLFTDAGFTTNASSNSFVKIIDGVVQFRVRALNTNGAAFGYVYVGPPTNAYLPQNPGIVFNNFLSTSNLDIFNNSLSPLRHEYTTAFRNTAVPAYVEIELGVLEDRILKRYNSMTNSGTSPGSIAWTYLQSHAAQVHVFRQRIPVRNVNPAAYQ